MYGQDDRGGPPSPVKEGDTATVKIDAKGKSGDGLARIEGFVVFVPGAEEGSEVKVRITSVRRRFATGEVVTGPGAASKLTVAPQAA